MKTHRKLLIPEVVQTSSIDCGPACLTSLLAGFGMHISYGRLREACQTGIDGSSIDVIEQLANQLGLEAEQLVVPIDHIVQPETGTLPAMTVVVTAGGLTHFVVAWSRYGNRVQVMDPASGRRWTRAADFLREIYVHEMRVPAAAWREFATSDEFTAGLCARLQALGLDYHDCAAFIARATGGRGCAPIATLDAAVRMLTAVRTRSVADRNEAVRLLNVLLERAETAQQDVFEFIPDRYWSVLPAGSSIDEVVLRGGVVLRVKGLKPSAGPEEVLTPEVAAAVSEKPPQPMLELWQMMKQDGVLRPAMVVAGLAASAVGVILQALVFRALIEGGTGLSQRGERVGAFVVLLGLLAILIGIDFPVISSLVAMGRRLETRLRMAFFDKLPRIAVQYFQSRPASDMVERGHNIHNIRGLPLLAGQFLSSSFSLIATTAAVIWIDPGLWPIALVCCIASIGIPLLAQSVLAERELRVRTHGGALSRLYLDSLLGLVPIRTHVAEDVVRGEHQRLLSRWCAASLSVIKAATTLDGVQMLVGFGMAALLVIYHAARYPESSALLLLVFWALSIPMIGRDLARQVSTYPIHRNVALRVMEPLAAMEAPLQELNAEAPKPVLVTPAASIAMEQVAVVAGGHPVLRNINLRIAAGEHVAIVGPSGAGKSSLLGLLLGWHSPAMGSVRVDDEVLSPAKLDRLREDTAWVDPTVHLWNRSLADNLRYGLKGDPAAGFSEVLDELDLGALLEKLPQGLQTGLGESGALVSGGEGQRIRMARAMLRPGIRLAILDEPFRGLDPDARQQLLETVRQIWSDATMLCVTHDVASTLAFNRVLVLHGGTILEDGAPARLAGNPKSLFAMLLQR